MADRRKSERQEYPSVRKRRTAVSEPLTKATYQISTSVTEGIRVAVQAGVAPSASVLVEEAVRARLRELRQSKLYDAYAAAARDPAFRADLDDTVAAFDPATADGLGDTRRKRSRR